MLEVEIYKKKTTIPDLYGKVRFDGQRVDFEGVTSVFKQCMERGIVTEDNKRVMPKDGMKFLLRLIAHLNEQGFSVSEILE